VPGTAIYICRREIRYGRFVSSLESVTVCSSVYTGDSSVRLVMLESWDEGFVVWDAELDTFRLANLVSRGKGISGWVHGR
jgi:hypothetical protein